jgi:hypothetical protein
VALARRGLARLQTLPDTPDRARRELPLQMTLGVQLQVAEGYAAPEAERTHARAHALCEQVPEASPLFPVLWGLWMYYGERRLEISPKPSYPALSSDAPFLVSQSLSRLGQGHRDGRLP